jgi:TPR repeat protein
VFHHSVLLLLKTIQDSKKWLLQDDSEERNDQNSDASVSSCQCYSCALRKNSSDALANLASLVYVGLFPALESNRELAIELLRFAAQDGSTNAACDLGYILGTSLDSKEKSEGVTLLKKEVSLQNFQAAEVLGSVLIASNPSALDDTNSEAIQFFKDAAEQGDSVAMARMAMILDKQGMMEQSIQYLEGSASRGYPLACTLLAGYLRQGVVVPKDLKRSLELYTLASRNGDVDAYEILVEFYTNIFPDALSGLSMKLEGALAGNPKCQEFLAESIIRQSALYVANAADQVTAQQTAILWYQRSADQGNPKAQLTLAAFYYSGELGVDKDPEKCLSLVEESIRGGSMEAYVLLAQMYMKGFGVEQSFVKSVEILQRAAALGSTRANFMIAQLSRTQDCEAIGLTSDHGLYMKHLKKAAQDIPEAQHVLAQEYLRESAMHDPYEACNWFIKAALGGYGPSMLNIAIMHRDGYGTEQNLGICMYWLQKAAQAGQEKSKEMFEQLIKVPQVEAMYKEHLSKFSPLNRSNSGPDFLKQSILLHPGAGSDYSEPILRDVFAGNWQQFL